MTSTEKDKKEVQVTKYYSETIKCDTSLDIDGIKKLHQDFQPLVAAYNLARLFDEISANKDNKDDAQKARLKKALGIMESDIPLSSFPDKTKSKLMKGVKKQLK